MADLRLGRRIVYDVKANWKLIVLNYNECLHCPNLHPTLNKLHHYLGADNVAPTACYCGGAMGFRDGVETMSMDGKRRRAYLPGLNEAQRQQVAYFAIYPNLLLSLHPDYVMTHTLWPRAPRPDEIVCEWHFHPTSSRAPISRATMPWSSGTSRTARTGGSPSSRRPASTRSSISRDRIPSARSSSGPSTKSSSVKRRAGRSARP